MCRRRSKSSVDSIRLLHDYITENVSEPTPKPSDCRFIARPGGGVMRLIDSDDLLFGAALLLVIAVVLLAIV